MVQLLDAVEKENRKLRVSDFNAKGEVDKLNKKITQLEKEVVNKSQVNEEKTVLVDQLREKKSHEEKLQTHREELIVTLLQEQKQLIRDNSDVTDYILDYANRNTVKVAVAGTQTAWDTNEGSSQTSLRLLGTDNTASDPEPGQPRARGHRGSITQYQSMQTRAPRPG